MFFCTLHASDSLTSLSGTHFEKEHLYARGETATAVTLAQTTPISQEQSRSLTVFCVVHCLVEADVGLKHTLIPQIKKIIVLIKFINTGNAILPCYKLEIPYKEK